MLRVLLSLCLLVVLTVPVRGEGRVLEIASTDYPPYYAADLPGQGFITEVVREAFEDSGYAVNVEFFPWKRAFEGARQGDFDALFTVWHRPEREDWFLFSRPLPANEVGFFRRADEEIVFDGLESLAGKAIGVVRGYALPPGFEAAGLTTSVFDDDEQTLRSLMRGRVDLVLTDRILARHILRTRMAGSMNEVAWVEPAVVVEPQFLVVPRALADADEILAAFDAGLERMQERGRVREIMQSHGF